MKIGIIAHSSPVPKNEFAFGLEKIKASLECDVVVHDSVWKKNLFFAGTSQERAQAFYEFASDPDIPIIWGARGGYGANHLLPLLEDLGEKKGIPPKKLFIGYSDSTALFNFLRTRWGWSTLHAGMPGARTFGLMPESDWTETLNLIRHGLSIGESPSKELQFLTGPPKSDIVGPLVGGNLCVWTTLLGTPYQAEADGKILFFEDIGESLSRLDRMVEQLKQAGFFSQAQALILGEFVGCEDTVPAVIKTSFKGKDPQKILKDPKPKDLMPLRPKITQKKAIQEIFAPISEKYGIPIAVGFPVGHGVRQVPLALGGAYQMTRDGMLQLRHWDWTPV